MHQHLLFSQMSRMLQCQYFQPTRHQALQIQVNLGEIPNGEVHGPTGEGPADGTTKEIGTNGQEATTKEVPTVPKMNIENVLPKIGRTHTKLGVTHEKL